MARNTVGDWSTDPDQNTDIGGINIAEYCPPSSVNNAIRTMMAQLVSVTTGILTRAGGAMVGAITSMGNASSVRDPAGTDRLIGYRGIPQVTKTAAYTIALTDMGQHIYGSSGGISVPDNASVAFPVEAAVSFVNNSDSSQNVTPASGVTLRLAGSSSTGTRVVSGRGMATLLKTATNEWYISGAGVS